MFKVIEKYSKEYKKKMFWVEEKDNLVGPFHHERNAESVRDKANKIASGNFYNLEKVNG